MVEFVSNRILLSVLLALVVVAAVYGASSGGGGGGSILASNRLNLRLNTAANSNSAPIFKLRKMAEAAASSSGRHQENEILVKENEPSTTSRDNEEENNNNNNNNNMLLVEPNGEEIGESGGGGGGGDFPLDDSVFGNTDESFFDFANRRMNELKNMNKMLFDKSIAQCPYAASSPLNVAGGGDTVESSNDVVNNKINQHKRCVPIIVS